jgi:hypothetical protein
MSKTAQRGFRILVWGAVTVFALGWSCPGTETGTTYHCHYSCPANEQSGNTDITAESASAAEAECRSTQASGCPDLSCTCS